jgi:hypothetical protein
MGRRGPASVLARKSSSKRIVEDRLTGSALRRACRMMLRLFGMNTNAMARRICSCCSHPWRGGERNKDPRRLTDELNVAGVGVRMPRRVAYLKRSIVRSPSPRKAATAVTAHPDRLVGLTRAQTRTRAAFIRPYGRPGVAS